jgi:FkbM family methyltransferase
VTPVAAGAPTWVRALSALVKTMPRGRYHLVSSVRSSSAPFIAALGNRAGTAKFACDLSDQIAREVCLTGCYEPPVTRLMERRLRSGGIFVDAGANWGYFSLLAAGLVGRTGCVFSLEPDPRQFASLVSNIQLNGFAQINASAQAAAARQGTGVLAGYVDRADNRGVSRLDDGGGDGPRFTVECVAIDDLTDGLAHVDLVKLDVEGAELDALCGMSRGLAAHKYRAVCLELHPGLLRARGVTPEDCLRVLLDAGYRGWTIDLSPRAYRRAGDPDVPPEEILRPLGNWEHQAWPHVLWLAPGVGQV